MISDARQLDLAELPEFDVCIAGGGPAGITLALELAGRGRSVVLAEGGGFERGGTEPELDPYRGELGFRRYSLEGTRLRYLGGSTGHWGGWCRPLDPVDFEHRREVEFSGWPFGRDELEPYYPRAHELVEIEQRDYRPETVLAGRDRGRLEALGAAGFATKIFRFSPPTRFGTRYREQLERADGVHVLLHANVVGIEREGERVLALRVATLDGERVALRARHFVLALGGIENARLLLHDTPEAGEQGLLGRCFMDHFGFRPGFAVARADLDFGRYTEDGATIQPVLSMSDEALREQGLRNFALQFTPEIPDSTLPASYLGNPTLGSAGEEHRFYKLQFICEPTPHPESRIRLSPRKDVLGMQRVHLDWRIAREDFDSVMRVSELLGKHLGLHGEGRLQHSRWDKPEARYNSTGGAHHMGTTRMADDPERGVVDRDCRRHGTENLFVAGSSVFPSVGFSNPTLTILALTQRLADHLEGLA